MSWLFFGLFFAVASPVHSQPLPEEVKAALRLCAEKTSHSDIRNRNLARNLEYEMADTCVLQKSPPTSGINLLNQQIKNTFSFTDVTGVWSGVNTIALKKTTKAIWSSYLKLIKNQNLSEKAALDLICRQVPRLCKSKTSMDAIKKSFQDFKKIISKKPVEFLSVKDQAHLLSTQLNPLIEHANKTCKTTKEILSEFKSAYTCLPDYSVMFKPGHEPLKKVSEGECKSRTEELIKKQYQLEEIASASLLKSLEKIYHSDLGPLLISDPLRKKLGAYEYNFARKTCSEGLGKILNPLTNADLNLARLDFYDLTLKELKKIDQYQSEDIFLAQKKQSLKQYLKTNPTTVAEFLRQNPKPENVNAICSLIQSIQHWDQASKISEGVMIGTGMIASVALAFTGVGSPAGAALATIITASTAMQVGKSSIDYLAQKNQDIRIRTSAATQQQNFDLALNELRLSDVKKGMYFDNITYTIAAEAIGFTFGKGIKLLAFLKKSESLNTLIEAGKFASTADRDRAMALKLENGVMMIHSSVVRSGYNTNHLIKLNGYQQAKLAAVYSNFDNSEADQFTKKLVNLKYPIQLEHLLDKAQSNLGN